MTENEIARQIVDAAYKIHTKFGPGLLESAYEALLIYELRKRGLRVEAQKPIPIIYEDVTLAACRRERFPGHLTALCGKMNNPL